MRTFSLVLGFAQNVFNIVFPKLDLVDDTFLLASLLTARLLFLILLEGTLTLRLSIVKRMLLIGCQVLGIQYLL